MNKDLEDILILLAMFFVSIYLFWVTRKNLNSLKSSNPSKQSKKIKAKKIITQGSILVQIGFLFWLAIASVYLIRMIVNYLSERAF